MQEIDLRGIIPAIVTPMTNDGALDVPALRRYVGWLAEQGPVALAVNVDTGEGPHLTPDEKRQTRIGQSGRYSGIFQTSIPTPVIFGRKRLHRR